MNLLDRYLERTDFTSYEDFAANFRMRVPERFNFAVDVVDTYAREVPDKRALVWCNDQGQERTFTFADLRQASDRVAGFFSSLGIGKGDPVMLVLKGRYEFWFCMLALHKLGAVAIPATHMMKSKDIAYRIRRADVRMVVVVDDPDLPDYIDLAQAETGDILRTKVIVGAEREGWHNFEAGMAAAPAYAYPGAEGAPANHDMMLLYFTSGTTGFPKMVQHDFVYPLAHILTARYWQHVEDDGLHYTVADSGWAKAVWGKIYGQWLAGSAVFVYDYERFTAAGVLGLATRHGVTSFCAPPTVYRFLIKEDLSQYDLGRLKYCVTAGEPLNPEVYEQFLAQTGIRLMEGYGQTELVVTAATWPWMEPKPGSMGRPTPSYEIVLMDAEGNPVERGEEGEIAIRASADTRPLGIFHGYYRDEDLTASVWRDGFYHTGDMAWQDEDGYLWFIGRADDVIKSSGYRIGPFEVESALIQHPAVLECAVTGVPDPNRGQVVKATVVLAKGYTPTDDLKATLQQHVKDVTEPYKYPRIVEFVAELPKTVSGKIRRVEIRGR